MIYKTIYYTYHFLMSYYFFWKPAWAFADIRVESSHPTQPGPKIPGVRHGNDYRIGLVHKWKSTENHGFSYEVFNIEIYSEIYQHNMFFFLAKFPLDQSNDTRSPSQRFPTVEANAMFVPRRQLRIVEMVSHCNAVRDIVLFPNIPCERSTRGVSKMWQKQCHRPFAILPEMGIE